MPQTVGKMGSLHQYDRETPYRYIGHPCSRCGRDHELIVY